MKYATFFIALFFLIRIAGAQTIIDGATVSISPDAVLAVDGSLFNQGEIHNQGGALAVSGDWENQQTYITETGTFILNGSTLQYVSHNNQDFDTLLITGGGEKVFLHHASVFGALQLTDGLVKPESGVFLIVRENAKISGASGSSYINGVLYHEGVGSKFFPVGKNGTYRPLQLTAIEGDMPVTGIELFEQTSTPAAETGLEWVSAERYWQRSLISGTYNGSPVQLWVSNDDNLTSLDNVVVAGAESPAGPFRSLGQSQTSGDAWDGTVTSNEAANSFYFAVAEKAEAVNLLYIPNALSPTATDANDRSIRIYGDYLSPDNDFIFRVYNKWGNLVFESTSLNEMTTTGWDGTNSETGEMQLTGHYNYYLKATAKNGESIEKQGSVLLLQ